MEEGELHQCGGVGAESWKRLGDRRWSHLWVSSLQSRLCQNNSVCARLEHQKLVQLCSINLAAVSAFSGGVMGVCGGALAHAWIRKLNYFERPNKAQSQTAARKRLKVRGVTAKTCQSENEAPQQNTHFIPFWLHSATAWSNTLPPH